MSRQCENPLAPPLPHVKPPHLATWQTVRPYVNTPHPAARREPECGLAGVKILHSVQVKNLDVGNALERVQLTYAAVSSNPAPRGGDSAAVLMTRT